jgi:hypothetical protein
MREHVLAIQQMPENVRVSHPVSSDQANEESQKGAEGKMEREKIADFLTQHWT